MSVDVNLIKSLCLYLFQCDFLHLKLALLLFINNWVYLFLLLLFSYVTITVSPEVCDGLLES